MTARKDGDAQRMWCPRSTCNEFATHEVVIDGKVTGRYCHTHALAAAKGDK